MRQADALLCGEIFLAGTAKRADKILRKFVEGYTCFDTVVRIAYFFVIFPTAKLTYILHFTKLLLIFYNFGYV